MNEEQIGPYDSIKCHFCGKSAKNGIEFIAGYERYETYANVGKPVPACKGCAAKPYEQPQQVQQKENETDNG